MLQLTAAITVNIINIHLLYKYQQYVNGIQGPTIRCLMLIMVPTMYLYLVLILKMVPIMFLLVPKYTFRPSLWL